MPRAQQGLARLVARHGVAEWIIDAFHDIDRADFVPAGSRGSAYSDRPVGLPHRQTTSQPSLIARMLDELALPEGGKALEIGTGYGFQTALLARRAGRVISIERHAELARGARENLSRAGIENVSVIVGDGWRGVPEEAPFDGIVVSAAASELPADLAPQLNEQSRIIIPIQELGGDAVYAYEKRGGQVSRVSMVTPARFVPLVPGSDS
jgi:protein-L-isoaspartate(D-aspartate) O-methyltransferase